MPFSVQLSPKFWILNGLIWLGGVFCLLAIAIIGVFLVRQSRGNADFPRLAPLILLAMLFFSFGGGLSYAWNQASRTATFRATPQGLSWTSWRRAHFHPWRGIQALVLTRSGKGWDILEIRCRKNAVEFDILEIDSTEVRDFQALVGELEKATHLRARRSN